MRRKIFGFALIGILALSACTLPGGSAQKPGIDTSLATPDPVRDDSLTKNGDANNEAVTNPSDNTDDLNADNGNDANTNDTEISIDDERVDELVDKVLKASGASAEEVRHTLAGDFDKDGTTEAFVFVGSESDEMMETCMGEIWFVSDTNCKSILQDGQIWETEGDVFQTCELSNQTMVMDIRRFVSNAVTDMYYVKNGDVYTFGVSGIGMFIEPDYVDDYCISLSDYDMIYDYTKGKEDEGMFVGHTWKYYYFYYDENSGEFLEYVGTKITEEELKKACGFDLAGEIRKEGFEVGDIFRRDNGIINVNYFEKGEYDNNDAYITYHNVTYNEKTKQFPKLSYDDEDSWKGSDFGGIYYKALTQ